MGFLDRFQADFAGFVNTGLAQVGGIITTLVVTRLFRSANSRWTAYRIVRPNWADLAQLADPAQPLAARAWTAQAVDRLGQIAARMALTNAGDVLHAANGLDDLRIGRNIIRARHGLEDRDADTRMVIEAALRDVSALYRARLSAHHPLPGPAVLQTSLERAIDVVASQPAKHKDPTVMALVGLRCNLFPQTHQHREAE